MKRMIILSMVLTVLLATSVAAAIVISDKLAARASSREGTFSVDGVDMDYNYAKISVSTGAIINGTDNVSKQIERARGYMKVRTPDREMYSVRLNIRSNPTEWVYSEEEITVEQEGFLVHTFREEYERNGRTRMRTVREKENVTVSYTILPEPRMITWMFDFSGGTFVLELDDISYYQCAKENIANNATGNTYCIRY